jgi:dihydrofolate reductase
MRRLVVGEFVSLDGVIQAPGGADEDTDGGFTRGGWTWPYWHDAIGEHFGRVMEQCDALLLGRKTWEIHGRAFEPMPADQEPFGARPKFVVSDTLTSADLWRHSTIIRGNELVEAVSRLKAEDGKDIYIDGSSVLIHSLVPTGLIDEYSLLVYPVVLGQGKRLFPDGPNLTLQLVESRVFPTGVQLLRYTAAPAS